MNPDQSQPIPPKNRWTRWYMWIIYICLGFSAAIFVIVGISIAVDDSGNQTQFDSADVHSPGPEQAVVSPTSTITSPPAPTSTKAPKSEELDARGYCIELGNPIRLVREFIDQTNGYIELANRGNAPTNTMKAIAAFGESMNEIAPYLREPRGPRNARGLEKNAETLADTIAEYAKHIREAVENGSTQSLKKADDAYIELRLRARNLENDLEEYCESIFQKTGG